MKIKKAIITAASRTQRHIPLQTVIDRDGHPRSVLSLLLDEIADTGIKETALVVSPGDEDLYREAAPGHQERLRFYVQEEARGYGHAVHCARDFTGDDPFLLMVSDHLYVSDDPEASCAAQLISAAERHASSMSAVQATHESKLPYFGAIAGRQYKTFDHLYGITRVAEKPTPTFAEQELVVPGMRQAHYLCFFGMHVLSPDIMTILDNQLAELAVDQNLNLSPALNELAHCSQYLALEVQGRRYDLEERYGLLYGHLAVALKSPYRDEVLSGLVDLLARSANR
ncbi:MAG: sugar phosphate nucleotidyltransferase [Verrucomicrobiota bacterium]